MLKMFINDEEVISNQTFEINEEMLNTSSTILNNVYPKTWEENKDYVNNFYYPQDYSNCMIIDEDKAITTNKGYITFENNNKTVKELNLYGNIEQKTTTGKNLFDTSLLPITKNGITVSVDAYGNVVLNGTPTITSDYIMIQMKSKTYASGTYTVSVKNKIQGIGIGVPMAGGSLNLTLSETVKNKTAEVSSSSTINCDIKIRYDVGTLANYILNPQLELNDNATEYEPYTNGASPNPEYPQEIKTAKGIENLFDGETEIGGYDINTGQKNTLQTQLRNKNKIKIKSNTTYIFSIESKKITQLPRYFYYDKDENLIKTEVPTTAGIFTTPNNAYYVNWHSTTLKTDYGETLPKPMIEEGTIVHDYIPYGTNYLPIKTTGKNLFDKINGNIINAFLNAANGSLQSNSIYRTLYIKCQPNTTYTIQKIAGTRFAISDTSKEQITLPMTTNMLVGRNTESSLTVTTHNDAKILIVMFYKTDSDTIPYIDMLNSIQIEFGSQKTEYESYKENTSLIDLQGNELAKIGNVKDELNIDENGNVTLIKRIGKVVLDGSEGWNRYIDTNKPVFWIATNVYSINYLEENGILCYSNYFQGKAITTSFDDVYNYGNNVIAFRSAYPRLVIRCDELTSVADFKTWLSNNNVTVYYVLKEPETIDLDKVDIKLLEGYNYLTLNSDISTSGIDLQLYNLLFSGVVENSGNISLRPTDPKYCSLQILSYKTFLSEGETLDFVINNKTIIEAIQMVVDACSEYGFVLGDVNIIGADDIIGAYSTLDKTPYDVFQYIADITQSRWTTRMVDSQTIAIDFYDPTLLPKGESIQYNNDWFKEKEIINISFNYSSRDYRNKQVMTSDKVFADIDYIETIYADGFNSKYLLSQEVGTIKSILLNGINKSFTSNQNKELGITADFYYSIESNELTSDEILASSSKIDITYQPLVQGRQVIRNSNEINRINSLLNRKGVISRFENRNDSLSSEELNKIGQSYIKYKGTPEITLTVETFNDLWKIGNVVMFNAPIEELNQEYMVKSKKTKIIASIDKVFYTYTLTSSFNSETEINYFDNQRNKAKGNLQEGQFINRNIDFESEANIIWNNFQYEEVSTTADNILDSLLNSPFVK